MTTTTEFLIAFLIALVILAIAVGACWYIIKTDNDRFEGIYNNRNKKYWK